jgi:DNA-binding beta-propeller fold protein YncE
MKQLLSVAALAIIILACQQKPKTDESSVKDSISAPPPPPVTLTLKWESDTTLTTNESVIYDKERDVLYVANINGAPDGKDGNGFISKLSTDGKIIELNWVKGLNAPKGMGIYKNKLYVADIDKVAEIDVTKGKITKSYPVKGAKFLNDITVDSTGRVFISDTGAGNIQIIENGKLTTFMDKVDGPNGLLSDNGKLYVLSYNGKTLSVIDPATKQITLLADSIDNADGFEPIGDGSFLASSWNGAVHFVSADNKITTVLDTRADSVQSADIEYIQEKNLLLVPNFFHNTVRAYELSKN